MAFYNTNACLFLAVSPNRGGLAAELQGELQHVVLLDRFLWVAQHLQ